ncbi:hypothetical protein RvY_12995 [Ramazzottius varieornatus]|uniref:Uncharacterized protein n=1 Tax=Ramazzottius varieornatus TaxID=947166 RepID=A0A1D1VLD4_RAMVA|nr:hypothetical protein RvY_12995 [Ramazzottius varieornatus]
MEFLHYRLQIRRITTCERTGFFHLDGLSIGLLVLAILLAISLIAGIIFVCCWIRIRRLRAVVKAAQPPPSLSAPSEFDVPKTPQFLTRPYHITSGWSSFGSIPTFTYGMTDPVFSPPLPVTLTRKKPPSSSCAANYEWQESTLDLAADNDSLNKVPLPISSSSSSAPSLPEDSGSHISRVSINYHRSDSPENTAL